MTQYSLFTDLDRNDGSKFSVQNSCLDIMVQLQRVALEYPDGLPSTAISSYSPNPRLSCATQSSSSLAEFTGLEGYYSPSPMEQHLTETAGPSALPRQQTTCQIGTSMAMTPTQTESLPHQGHSQARYPSPQQISPPQQGLWASGSCSDDDYDNYSLHGSPTACGGAINQSSSSSTQASPRTWTSSGDPFQQVVWKAPPENLQNSIHHHHPSGLRIHYTPISPDDIHFSPHPPATMPPTPYTSRSVDFNSIFDSPEGGYPHVSHAGTAHYPVPPQSHLDSFVGMAGDGLSPCSTSLKLEPGLGLDDELSSAPQSECGEDGMVASGPGQQHGGAPSAVATPAGTAVVKTEEPYAQLIYKAFLTKEGHAMTLQEIYQWFRENTDKAKSESKGWQNSIRHNLSMNAAFNKRERKPPGSPADATDPLAPIDGGDHGKKSTEWVLEPWAVEGGVQSTTRYRKGNGSRRGGPGSSSSTRQQQHRARASSGRKGGLSASKAKAAATTKAAIRRGQQAPQGQQSQTSPSTSHHAAEGQFGTFQTRRVDMRGLHSPSTTTFGAGMGMGMGILTLPTSSAASHRTSAFEQDFEHLPPAFTDASISSSSAHRAPTVKSDDEPMTPEPSVGDGLLLPELRNTTSSSSMYPYDITGTSSSSNHHHLSDTYAFGLGDVVGVYGGASIAGRAPPLFATAEDVSGMLCPYPDIGDDDGFPSY